MPPVLIRVLKTTLKVLAVLLAVVVLAGLLLLWRLSSSPIQLNQLVPRIERAVSNLPGGFIVRLKGVDLYWDHAERQVDLRVLSVDLLDATGSSLASVPEVDISISGFALLRGVFALSSIELRDVDVNLVRDKDGSFRVLEHTGSAAKPDKRGEGQNKLHALGQLFKTLQADEDIDHPISYLKSMKISGTVQIEDRSNGVNWSANAIESIFIGHNGEVEGHLGVKFSSPAVLSGIHTDITVRMKDDDVTARLEFTGVRPAGFANLDQRLAAFAGLDLSLDGSIDASLTLPDSIHGLKATVSSGAGRFSHPDYYPGVVKLNALEMLLSVDPAGDALQVSSLTLQLGDKSAPLTLKSKGSVQMLDEAVAVRTETTLQNLETSDLDEYWPAGVAQGARSWLVANLRAGTVDKAALQLGMQVPRGRDSQFQLGELNGRLQYRDLTVAYLGDMPAAAGVTGAGTFDRHGFDLDIRSGQVNGIDIESGKVLISGLDEGKAAISINTRLAGPVAAVFAVLETPPVSLGAHDRDDPISKRLEGMIEADFSIGLPLKSGLAADEIEYRAAGKISKGGLKNIYRGLDVRDAMLDLGVGPEKVTLNGPLEFAGIPLTLDWTVNNNGPARGHSDFSIHAPQVTGARLNGLGLAAHDYLEGSFALSSSGQLAPGGRLSASVETDFKHAALTAPQINWSKKSGDDGGVKLSLAMEKDRLRISDVAVDLGTIKTGGKVELDMAGAAMNLSVAQLSLPFAELEDLRLAREGPGKLRFSLAGGVARLAPFLSADKQAGKAAKIQLPAAPVNADQERGASGVTVEIGPSALDKVYINADTHLDNVRFEGRWENGGWQSFKVLGSDPSAGASALSASPAAASGKLAAGQFSLVFGPPENERYAVRLEVANLGSLVSTLAGKDLMSGGYLVLDGSSVGTLLTKPIDANFEIDGFTLKQTPGIVTVLNMASLTQILSTLKQSGLAFAAASGDIQLDGSRLSSRQIKMSGGSLGVFVGGWADLGNQTLETAGTVVPLNKIHKLVGKVPVIGQVVVGKDGIGMMAVNYKITGKMNEPEVSVSKAPLTIGTLKILGDVEEDNESAERQ